MPLGPKQPRRIRREAGVRHVWAILRSMATPEDVVRILKGPELRYVCDLCQALDELGLCPDEPLDEEDDDYA